MFDVLATTLTLPATWFKLLFALGTSFAIWRIGLTLIGLVCTYLHDRLASLLRLSWTVVCAYAALAATVYALALVDVPLLYDNGALIAQGFRNRAGQVVVVFALTLIAWNLVTLASRRMIPEAQQDAAFTRRSVRVQTLTGVIESSLRVVIVVLALISVLQALGINASALLAGVSVLGLAVGFGAQSLIKDVFTGFFILLEDQYGVGDVIAVNNGALNGTVERLNLRLTGLRALDGTLHIIPNGQILTVSVSSKDWARVVAAVDLAATTDPSAALQVLQTVTDALYQDPAWKHHFLAAPEQQGVTRLSPDSFTIRALMKVLPKSQYPVGREFNRRIQAALTEAGINTPAPAADPVPLSINPIEVRLLPATAHDLPLHLDKPEPTV
ncbi:mechanosensitive ion channel family protein [Deinococcus sonorensis]|uniref:Mechanosensitive ion channel family protein n=2 Tax=Deinococcus sonorensis TaxID=309891 RepID=A0AAU7UE03_9DEIO